MVSRALGIAYNAMYARPQPPFRHTCVPDDEDPDAPCDCREIWEDEGDRRYQRSKDEAP